MVECSGQRQSASAASCVNAKGGFWFTTYWGTMTAGKFCELLRKLMNGRRQPLFLVLDSLPAHKAKLVRKYVASTKGRLEPHFLPRYAPELNPDELVWNHLKRNGTAKRPLAEGENLCHRVAADLLAIKRRPLFPPGAKCARSVQFSISDHAEEVAARCAGWGSAGESDHCGEDRSLERAAQG